MRIVYYFCFVLLFFSCTTEKENEAQEIGRAIVLPDTLPYLLNNNKYTFDSSKLYNGKKYKIVMSIIGDCQKCAKFGEMIQEILDLYRKEANVFIYVNTNNYHFFLKYILPYYPKLKHPLIIDEYGVFISENNFNYRNQIFLLDNDNRIVIKGNPIVEKKVKNIYDKLLKRCMD